MTPRISRLVGSVILFFSFLLTASMVVRAQETTTSLGSPEQQRIAPVRPWTREEMLAAKPYPITAVKGSPDSAAVVQPTGKPESGSSGRGADASLKESVIGPELEAASAVLANAYTYPFPYSRYENLAADYSAFPYRTIGKVFFKKGGTPFVCSGSSIGNYGIITAGHCVSDGQGTFHTDWVFVPAYNAGAAPYGQWSPSYLLVSSLWHTGGGSLWSEDFGGAVLNKLSGLKISQKVGWLGWSVNLPVTQHWHSIGYPLAPPFTGKKQIVCAASWATNDGTNRFGIGCDATGGTSGGPLIRVLRPGFTGATNYVNGLNSYKYNNQPQALYSPYFGNNAKSHIGCLINSGPATFKCSGPPVP